MNQMIKLNGLRQNQCCESWQRLPLVVVVSEGLAPDHDVYVADGSLADDPLICPRPQLHIVSPIPGTEALEDALRNAPRSGVAEC